MNIAVIGSGPSGWASAKWLQTQGHEVTVIDCGLTEEEGETKSNQQSEVGLGQKLYFGSDLPYRYFPYGPMLIKENVNPKISFASGGLSLIWGATMLPYCKFDTSSWPIDISELGDYYKEITKVLPVSGSQDGLSTLYGDFYSRRGIFPSRRILRFMENATRVKEEHFSIGLSRLAVETGKDAQRGCVYCNRCISGCPDDYIWNSRTAGLGLKRLKMRVMKLREDDSKVLIDGLTIDGSFINELSFDRVLLAAGAIESFRILANSGIVEKSVVLKDSATFFFPLLAKRKIGIEKNNSFALSQCFIRLTASKKNSSAQFQLYEYSEDLIHRARNGFPFGRLVPAWLIRTILKRMIICIGYLDGKDSASIHMKLLDSGDVQLNLNEQGQTLKIGQQKIDASIRELSKLVSKHGLIPLKFLRKIAQPGEGVHFGSWLPMGLKSDLFGRPNGYRNIYVVDSSVLPSIAPGPITFTAMANAIRIAERVK